MNIVAHYKTSFLCIDMQDEKDLSLSSLLKNPNYLHEYIHYIQDISSVFGLQNIAIYNEQVRNIITSAHHNVNKQIEVPFVVPEGDYKNFHILYNHSSGGERESFRVIREISNVEIYGKEISEVVVTLKINNNTEFDYLTFGAYAINEYMANYLEYCLTGKMPLSDDYPYNFAKKIVEYICPKFAQEELNILALCDLSIQTHNPGVVFVKYLQFIQDSDWTPPKPEVIYEHFYQSNWPKTPFETEIINNANRTKASLLSYFENNCDFQNEMYWINTVILRACKYRLVDKYLILRIAKGGLAIDNELFLSLHKCIGTPNIINNIGDCVAYLHDKKIDIMHLLALCQAIRIFDNDNNHNQCICHSICKKADLHINDKCSAAPWTRDMEDSTLCYFTRLWKHWKLNGYYPIANSFTI